VSASTRRSGATLFNPGTVPLTIASLTASGDFLVSNDCGGAVAGGGSCSIEVLFAPESVADHLLGQVTITTDAITSPGVIELEGRSVDPELAVADVTLSEGDAGSVDAIFTVALNAPSVFPITTEYASFDGTAIAGEDYEAVAGVVTFDPGTTSQLVQVPVLGDVILEPDEETFTVELFEVVNAIYGDADATATIVDDERCPGPNTLVNAGAEQRPTGPGLPGWSQVLGSDWQRARREPGAFEGAAFFYAGETADAELAQDVDVAAFAAGIDAGVQLFAFEGWVRSLDESPPDTARIIVEFRDLTNSSVLSSFDSGAIASPTEWVAVTDERLAPRGTGWIRVRLLSTRWNGVANDGYFDSLWLGSLRTPTLLAGDAWAYEGHVETGELSLPVTLPCPYYQEVGFDYVTADGTALAGQDYLATSGSAALTVGETVAPVVVPILGDREDEPHEILFLSVEPTAPRELVHLDVEGIGTIFNDDFCPEKVAFWKNHPESWPIDYLVLGDVEYERVGLMGFLDYSGPNVPSRLAQQLVATKLNLEVGSDPEVWPLVDEVDGYLIEHPPQSKPERDEQKRGRALIKALKSYNTGQCRK